MVWGVGSTCTDGLGCREYLYRWFGVSGVPVQIIPSGASGISAVGYRAVETFCFLQTLLNIYARRYCVQVRSMAHNILPDLQL